MPKYNQVSKVELLESPKYYMALMALFRNEARFLKEWIEFYKLMGVEHFYLFNHLSEDDYMSVLEPYIKDGMVELTHLTQDPQNKDEWYRIQLATYSTVIKKVADQVEWLVIVDTDEFMFPKREQSLTAVLKQYDDYAGLSVSWRKFGTSNVEIIGNNDLMIEELQYRDNILELLVKSVVKPRYVYGFINPHVSIMKPGYVAVTENYERFNGYVTDIPSHNIVTINHYSNRDGKFFNSTKLARVHLIDQSLSSEERDVRVSNVIKEDERYSSVYDDSISRFAPALRMQIFHNHPDMSSINIEKLLGNKQLVHLPDDLLYVMEVGVNISYSMKNGYGVDPIMIKKMRAFTKEGESYAEIGGSNYGEFALQMRKTLGSDGVVYIFESDQILSQYYATNRFLNNASNVNLEGDVVVMDSYFQDRESSLDIVRINPGENACNILGGMENIIDSSKDLRLFIKWSSGTEKCLADLAEKGFIFIDILKFNEECSYLNSQLNYQLTIDDIANSGDIEILAVRKETFENYRKLYSDNPECVALASRMMFFAAYDGRVDDVKDCLSKGADINYYEEDVSSPALHSAVAENHPSVVNLLLREGADIELGYKRVVTPLFKAAEHGRKDMVEMLLCYNANREFTFFGRSPAQVALDNGHTEVYQMLLGEVEINCVDGDLG
jgi:hypothetical protein